MGIGGMSHAVRRVAMPQLLDVDRALSAYLDTLLAEVDPLLAPVKEDLRAADAVSAAQPDDRKWSRADTLFRVPEWAQSPFQVLQLQLQGLMLALPLTSLHGVVEWPHEVVAKIPTQRRWLLGLLPLRGRNTQVIDLSQLLDWEPKPREVQQQDSIKSRHIVLVDSGCIGLVCDRIDEVVTLHDGDVQWANTTDSDKVRLGTIKRSLISLIDPAAIPTAIHRAQGKPLV